MASVSKLARLVGQNLKRNTKDFVFSSFGIVVGISTFIFFVALGQGIKTVVLEEIFVINQLEVVQPSYDVGVFRTEGSLFGGGRKLDDQMADELRRLDGVAGVYPKMRFEFPARAWGGQEIIGKTFWTEMIADGIPAELVAPDLKNPELFRDWDA
ncbi:MAG: ABC transporter permease, partial [Myxococcota bacterium]